MTGQCGDCPDGSGSGCSENTDPRRLVREGTSQAERAGAAPLATLVPVDERRAEHAMVFAAAYADYLRYVDLTGSAVDNWRRFFDSDLSARLAVAAVEDVAGYRTTVKSLLRELEDPALPPDETAMVAALGAVLDCIGTLAVGLDDLARSLPPAHGLRATLGNLIHSHLSPMLRRLIGYHSAGVVLGAMDPSTPAPGDVVILGRAAQSFDVLVTGPGLRAPEWAAGVDVADWAEYIDVQPSDYAGAYGTGTTTVERVNHLATHNLFTTACETFLAAHARVVDEARAAVEVSLADNGHEPHYALFLAFLKLLEYARADVNTLTGKHLDFYYRDVLRLSERPAEPSHAHLLVQLAKHVDSHLVAHGTLLRAGKDSSGAEVHFTVDRDLVANKGAVTELMSIYRHPPEGRLASDRGRIFARPAIDPGPGESWHPFAEEVFEDAELTEIDMPPAQVGFAVASHYLWMAEGARTLDIGLATSQPISAELTGLNLRCRLTTEKGWIDRKVSSLQVGEDDLLHLGVTLDGSDPPVTPYDPATHGFSFTTALPVLLVLLAHEDGVQWDYPTLGDIGLQSVKVTVAVDGVRTLALSNDHGPVDGSKPFLAYGSTPTKGSSLVIGSKEVFQKGLTSLVVNTVHMTTPTEADEVTAPKVTGYRLSKGTWTQTGPDDEGVGHGSYDFGGVTQPAFDAPDLTADTPYSTTSRTGFIRLTLDGGFGTDLYPVQLAAWVAGGGETDRPTQPVLPLLGSLTLDYVAEQVLDLSAASEATGRFFHVTPFGHAEVTKPSGQSVPLLPQFLVGSQPAEGELYIGVRNVVPPQDLTLLFQVVDGTANPLVVKPERHLTWAYLRGTEWMPLGADQVSDGTGGLLASGIVRVSVPADSTTEHTLMPRGTRWLRLAVVSQSDAVCRLLTVEAQSLQATYAVRDPGADAQSGVLPPGTVSKLDSPDAAVKSVAQPYPTFGGRATETAPAFATRVSERLRHKDRAIALWDYEHLVLEAFPSIYQARCLNHTRYEPTANGTGIYREMAPGHVTVVTIPDLALPNPRDPLRPFTSLHLLDEIEQFLTRRTSCFARLHVRNPQFEQVLVDLRVRLRDGFDETFHLNALKGEITRFLSPWAYRDDARPTFDGKVYKSVLVNFVEQRPYVDYVTDERLFRRLPGATADGPDLEEVTGSRAISILVSVPAGQHRTHVIHAHEAAAPDGCSCSEVSA